MAQTSITLTINTPAGMTAVQALDYFSRNNGYVSILPDGTANPETQLAFTKRKLGEIIVANIHNQRLMDASSTAITTESAKPDVTIS